MFGADGAFGLTVVTGLVVDVAEVAAEDLSVSGFERERKGSVEILTRRGKGGHHERYRKW